MLRVKVTVQRLDYNAAVTKKASDAWTRRALKKAALAFFKAALPLIHVWTGMSIASFTNLADFLGREIQFSPRASGPKWKYWPTGQVRTPQLGVPMATPVNEIITRSPISNKPIFQYWTTVWQFVFYDTHSNAKSHDPAWGAFRAGQDAAITAMNVASVTLPNLDTLMTKSEVRFLASPGNVTKGVIKQRQSTVH